MDPESRYRQVAAMHAANIDQGFLSTLGEPFLEQIYRAIDAAPSGVLIVEERDGVVMGFVSGGEGMREVYRQMLRRPLALGLSLLPSLFRPARLRRILEILRYGQGKHGQEALPQAELLSIAVATEARGQGIADALYRRFVRHCRSRGIGGFRIVVGDALAPAHRFYRRMGARPVSRVEIHAGEGSVVYVQDVPADAEGG
jgi:ribosomal protein S18 acetylase RimI-like enzyme